MTTRGTAFLRSTALLFAGALACWGQSGNPGQANFLEYAQSGFDGYLENLNWSQQQWFQNNVSAMVVWSPFFDGDNSWYSNGYVYDDLYAIYAGSAVEYQNPQWIAKDQYGNWLYIPFACSGGTCPQYAGDISNPAFRAWWISNAQSLLSKGYPGLFIDDVNMQFNVSDGWGNLVAPIDYNTGQPMTYDAWRSYVAAFTQQIRQAFPYTKIMHNAIWFAGPAPAYDQDPYIQAELQSANTINLERGIASDGGLTGGTGFWSIYNFFSYVDRVHALGKGVDFEQYQLNSTGLEYGLASYFLISTGGDFVSDQTTTPSNWYNGYSVNLGQPLGARTYNNGVFMRYFTNGVVVLGEPNLGTQTVGLNGWYQDLNGNWTNQVTIGGWQGAVLTGSNSAATAASAAVSTPAAAPASSGGGTTYYLNNITPAYSVNGYGPIRINQNTGQGPLVLNGVTYQNGIGVNAYSEQHYSMYGGCSSFSGMAGMDSAVPYGIGNIKFQIWADGNLLWDSGFMQGGSPAASFSVNVSGYQTLAIVVTNGTWMAPSWMVYNDNGDWVNPTLVCS